MAKETIAEMAEQDTGTFSALKESGLFIDYDLTEKDIPEDILSLIDRETAIKYRILPLGYTNTGFLIVTDSTKTIKNRSTIDNYFKERDFKGFVDIALTEPDNLQAALVKFYKFNSEDRRSLLVGVQTEGDDDMGSLRSIMRMMLRDAITAKASDIHIRPAPTAIYVHFRVNGHLIDMTAKYDLRPSLAMAIINICKSFDTSRNADMSMMNMPTRGSFTMAVKSDEVVDFRLSTVPLDDASGNQKVNFRLLPQTKRRISLDTIGYQPDDLMIIKQTLYKNATGLFINSGPTGSGKTTSLYGQIYYVYNANGEPLHVMTIENPIEIKEELFTQVQVRADAEQENLRLTANDILTVGLRQDPDVFLFGEIRNEEDADAAIKASTTGHKVFTTVHASNCIKTITRLLDLNVSRVSLLSEIQLIISQRLVGLLCPKCSKKHILTEIEKSLLSPEEYAYLTDSTADLREKGDKKAIQACDCSFGLTGRTAVAELVVFDMELRDLLLDKSKFSEVAALLDKKGFKNMWQKGLPLVHDGKIELSELIHVVGKID